MSDQSAPTTTLSADSPESTTVDPTAAVQHREERKLFFADALRTAWGLNNRQTLRWSVRHRASDRSARSLIALTELPLDPAGTVIIYARSAIPGRWPSFQLAEQCVSIEAQVERAGLRARVAIVAIVGGGAAIDDRPDLDRVLALAQEPGHEVVATYDPIRISRSTEAVAGFAKQLSDLDVRLAWTTSGGLQFSDDVDSSTIELSRFATEKLKIADREAEAVWRDIAGADGAEPHHRPKR